MKFTTLLNNKRKIGQTLDYSLETITEGLSKPVATVTEKNKLPVWSPTIFEGNRCGKNAKYLTMLVYDIDDGTSLQSWRCFSDHYVIVHTSFSHRPNHNKFRIIIPLKNPIPAAEWKTRGYRAAIQHWDSLIGVGGPDPKAMKDVARIYYRYAIPNSDLSIDSPMHPLNYHYANYHVGQLLDLKYDHIKIKPKKPIKKINLHSSEIDLDDVFLDPRYRQTVAEKLGANIYGNHAKNIICPQCHRPDVVFSIDVNQPNSIKWPKCNRLTTATKSGCDWYGSFRQLLGA